MPGTIRCPCCDLPIPITGDDVGLTVTCPRTRRLIAVKESDARAVRTPPAPKPTAAPRVPASPAVPHVPREPAANRTNRLLVGVVCAQTLLLVTVIVFFVSRERRALTADRDSLVPATSRVEPPTATPGPAPSRPDVREEKAPVPEPKGEPRRDPAPPADLPLPAPRVVPAVEDPSPGGVAKAPDALRALVADLKAKEPADRVKALRAIAAFGPEAKVVAEHLIETMRDPAPEVRLAACEALEKVCPRIYPHVFTLLHGMDKSGALRKLEELGAEAAPVVAMLLDWYKNPSHVPEGLGGRTRFDGLKGFDEVRLKSFDTAVDSIVRIAPKDPRLAAIILAWVAGPYPGLSAGLTGPSAFSTRRSTAIDLLPVIDASKEAKVKVLVAALEDGHELRAVIEALERYGKDAAPALPLLRKMKFSSDDFLRDLATRAIAAIE